MYNNTFTNKYAMSVLCMAHNIVQVTLWWQTEFYSGECTDLEYW